MGYMIQYGPSGKAERIWQKKQINRRAMIAAAVVAAICCMFLLLTVDIHQLKELLIPGDPAVTKEAFAQFTEDIRQGTPVSDAITTFCQEIIDHGMASQ